MFENLFKASYAEVLSKLSFVLKHIFYRSCNMIFDEILRHDITIKMSICEKEFQNILGMEMYFDWLIDA